MRLKVLRVFRYLSCQNSWSQKTATLVSVIPLTVAQLSTKWVSKHQQLRYSTLIMRQAILIGEPNKGLKSHVYLYEHCPLRTGMEGLAHMELAFQNPALYAKERRSMPYQVPKSQTKWLMRLSIMPMLRMLLSPKSPLQKARSNDLSRITALIKCLKSDDRWRCWVQ